MGLQTKELYRELLSALAEGGRAAVVSRYGSGGDGTVQKEVAREADAVRWAEISALAASPGAVSDGPVVHIPPSAGGTELVVIETYLPKPRLVILGGGHIALALTKMAKLCEFSALVFDDRPMFASPERFPDADTVIMDDFSRVFERVNIRETDYVVIVTRGHKHDQECLEGVLKGASPAYTGMIGSRRRTAIVLKQLEAAGYPRAALENVHTPIGLKIGAVTPAEISVAILAEAIGYRRGGAAVCAADAAGEAINSAGALHRAGPDPGEEAGCDFETAELLARHGEDMDALLTILETHGSVPRETGAKMAMSYAGGLLGTIGGGCAEAGVMQDARTVIREGGTLIREIDMTDTAEEDGMVCGGRMRILIEKA
ncbi:MAG: XdhC family protein [Clostridiales bacterium]|nr:XdhC family protein [Clostridiales bacterium]